MGFGKAGSACLDPWSTRDSKEKLEGSRYLVGEIRNQIHQRGQVIMDQLRALMEQAQEMWGGLDRNRKIAFGGGGGLVVILLIVLSAVGGENKVEYLPLYTDLDLKEAGELSARLRELNQDYQLGGDGTLVMVPEEDRLRLRAALAAEGFPTTGLIGYEIFDEVPLGMTDFLQKIKMRQALEGELKKTIMELEQVEDVRLHVVIPEPSLFTEDQKITTASILLRLRQRMAPTTRQIEGIQRLVAASVEGLDFRNIVVADTEGNLLSEEIDPLARLTSKQLEVQRNVENYLEARAQETLDHVLGPDQAVVRITTELSFDQTEETVEAFDPASRVIRSEQRNEESSAEAGTKESTVSNYEVNKTIKRIAGSVGSIRRISVSLTVNRNVPNIPKAAEGEAVPFRDRTPEEIDMVADLVRGAVGLDTARGDQLQISSFPFAITDIRAQQDIKRKADEREALITEIILNAAKLIGVIMALLVLRAIIGAIGRGVAREEEIALQATAELEDESVTEELPETPHELLLGRIAHLISERPEDAAKLIRTMLIEDTAQTKPATT